MQQTPPQGANNGMSAGRAFAGYQAPNSWNSSFPAKCKETNSGTHDETDRTMDVILGACGITDTASTQPFSWFINNTLL
jgi:hypothetical protein